MKQKTGVIKDRGKIYKALIIVLTIALLVVVAGGITGGWKKERAPSFSFAFDATDLSDERGTIDIHGGGKFSYMGGYGWGPYLWWWNVYVDGHGGITFVTNGIEESVRWRLKPTGNLVSNGFYDQLTGNLNFTLQTITGNLPGWVTEPIEVSLFAGGDSTGKIIVNLGGISTYTGTGTVVIH